MKELTSHALLRAINGNMLIPNRHKDLNHLAGEGENFEEGKEKSRTETPARCRISKYAVDQSSRQAHSEREGGILPKKTNRRTCHGLRPDSG